MEDKTLAVLNQKVMELYRAGKYARAALVAQKALQVAEQHFGPDHPAVASGLNNLAYIYNTQGDYANAEPLYNRFYKRWLAIKAEPLFKRSLAIWEKALGPDHPDVATSLNNLATLYYQQGDYAKAEPLFKRSLAILEKALGPDNPAVVTSLHTLARFYWDQSGDPDKIKSLRERAWAIEKKALGPDHPDVATILDTLVDVSYAKEMLGELSSPIAITLYKRALVIQEKVLGPDHLDVATRLDNLARLYIKNDRYYRTSHDAEPLFQRSLAIREKALGPDHPDVALSLNNLAVFYDDDAKLTPRSYANLAPIYKRLQAISEKVLGPDHLAVATSLDTLANFYCRAHDDDNEQYLYDDNGQYFDDLDKGYFPYYNKAEPLFKRALDIREKALGPNHLDVATSLDNLARFYKIKSENRINYATTDFNGPQGHYVEAETLYKRSLEIREKVLGPDHPDVAKSLETLGYHYASFSEDFANGSTENLAKAKALFERALKIRESAIAASHEKSAAMCWAIERVSITEALNQRMACQQGASPDGNAAGSLLPGRFDAQPARLEGRFCPAFVKSG